MEFYQNGSVWLQLIDQDKPSKVWVEAWFDLPSGNCVVQRFNEVPTGKPTYTLISETIEKFGREAMEAKLNSLQISDGFAILYLYPAITEQHEARWN